MRIEKRICYLLAALAKTLHVHFEGRQGFV